MIRILGIPLFAENIESATRLVLNESTLHNNNKLVSATGAHGLVYAKKRPKFKSILESFYLNLPDGMPGVWVGRMKGAHKMQRCYGPDFFEEVMVESASTQMKHFFCGGKEGVADRLKDACEMKFSNYNIVGTHCPPFKSVDEYDYDEISQIIKESNADIVWIGLSTPKQEQFAFHLSKHTRVKFIICVGAAFDFHIGNVRQAPSWIQKMGMEWCFRLFMEPKRLWKRYFEIVPLFIYYNFAEFVIGKFYKKES
ncbi:MAG: WecB/TagA/CpsF family glycosyltransferase [Marinoscillum sp.]|uniref:WecB/TagA/CpsF family glycosyltransferase n=1 Tax=Marinoscillum sp. TaxID=2024838 RepID=UPI0032F8BD45